MKTKEEKTQEAFDMLTGFLDPHGFTELCDEFYDVVAEAMQEYASQYEKPVDWKKLEEEFYGKFCGLQGAGGFGTWYYFLAESSPETIFDWFRNKLKTK